MHTTHTHTLTQHTHQVLKLLAKQNRLLFKSSVTHPYPHCWRCKKPLTFRSTPQWFCSLHSLVRLCFVCIVSLCVCLSVSLTHTHTLVCSLLELSTHSHTHTTPSHPFQIEKSQRIVKEKVQFVPAKAKSRLLSLMAGRTEWYTHHRHRLTERHRHTHTERERRTETHTETDTETDTETETHT